MADRKRSEVNSSEVGAIDPKEVIGYHPFPIAFSGVSGAFISNKSRVLV